jgi:hypothetical protein
MARGIGPGAFGPGHLARGIKIFFDKKDPLSLDIQDKGDLFFLPIFPKIKGGMGGLRGSCEAVTDPFSDPHTDPWTKTIAAVPMGR